VSDPVRAAVCLLIVACLALGARHAASTGAVGGPRAIDDAGATYRLDEATAQRAGVALLDEEIRASTFRFDRTVTPEHRAVFLAAVAGARPQARRLIDLVDGLVTVSIGVPPRDRAIGLTRFDGEDYDVIVEIVGVVQHHGGRGVSALILHELGHVVDRALVPDDLMAQLDAYIPTGELCRPGEPTGACATVQERFADTFAKWAMDDLGVYGTVGYRILPPVPIGRWGEPLARLAEGA